MLFEEAASLRLCEFAQIGGDDKLVEFVLPSRVIGALIQG